MDVVTLFGANATILVVMSWGFFAAARTNPDEPWWFSWIVANLTLAAGLVIFALLPSSAAKANSVPHCLLVLGFGFRWRAAQLFVRGRSSWLPVFAPTGVTILLFALPGVFSPGFVYAAVNVILAVQTAGIAWQFWRGRQPALPSSYGLVISYCVVAVSFATRSAHGAAFLDQFTSYLPHDRMLQLHLVIAVIHTTASGAFALSLAYERVVDRHRHAASHDELTDLANRTLFNDRLRQALAGAQAAGTNVGLLLLDIDHFKQVNDTFGHDVGDELLRTFASRLQRAVRSGDTVARLGGDEFAVVLPDMGGTRDLSAVAATLVERMSEPLECSGRVLTCRASIGASSFPQHGITPEELLKNADIALYAAKFAGRGASLVFDASMRSRETRPAH